MNITIKYPTLIYYNYGTPQAILLHARCIILKNNMPPEFNELLKQSGKPFFDLIEAITKFSKVHNIKKVPNIQIPDSLM